MRFDPRDLASDLLFQLRTLPQELIECLPGAGDVLLFPGDAASAARRGRCPLDVLAAEDLSAEERAEDR
ncbi:MAG: hypothetical protein MUF48_24310, partial [Pirellulaceae bacterium]|nr:hypothetical protein [Pirellulaceae bacterium]